ncbi:hypothetical protein DM01DRAFT_1384287 [Hesseltinella vesiculosa]|uniref:Arrestin C-terminal-like domain-containing protein n=1 Tax=Hesseltinella vesiculosa TaxID=101127 RepID=A0A1X2GET5_9FUNG|nr:hypothetical protein DM01DRAFT_1384287 [Hesseltinella vesiculosa]
MKDGFKRFLIEPTVDTLEFMGPGHSSENVQLLEGTIHLSLTRPIKIKSMAVKFKGFGRVSINGKVANTVLDSPILPKLKCNIASKTLLPAGNHIIPWDMQIPNIFPPSILIKRATVYYRVEATISFALAKAISAEHPIILRRHLLPCIELAPLVETKLHERTIPAKFHYEIEAPQIVCLDQLLLPFAVKYLCIANQKAVQSIRTQLTQIELYKINSISKAESNLTLMPMDVYNLDKKVADCKQRRDYGKYIKRTIPALIHVVDKSRTSAWQQPIVLRHKLHQFLHPSYDSPLVTIHHQLEVTFQFGHRFEDIKAKIPIIIASVPGETTAPAKNSLPWSSLPEGYKYPFETVTRYESTMVYPETSLPANATEAAAVDGLPRSSEDSTNHRGIPSIMVDAAIHVHTLPPAPLRPPLSEKGNNKRQRTPSPPHPSRSEQVPIWDSPLPNLPPPSRSCPKTSNSSMNLTEYNHTRQPFERPHTSAATSRPLQQPQPWANYRETSKPATDIKYAKPRRRPLPPIDVELANGIKPKIMVSTLVQTNSSSEVLPEADRNILQASRQGYRNDLHLVQGDGEDDDDDFDFQSVYSDISMQSHDLAPGLSSSASDGSLGSHHDSFISRPPSPSNRPPAPGLPSNTALRSHQEERQALVEESFDYLHITSPAIATMASSVLSPCNSNASTASSGTRRRIALSSVSSLMNQTASDSLSFQSFGGPFSPRFRQSFGMASSIISAASAIPPLPTTSLRSRSMETNRVSSTDMALDGDEQDPIDPGRDLLLPHSDGHGHEDDNEQASTTLDVLKDHDRESQQAAYTTAAKQRYLHAKLPPIPAGQQQQSIPTTSSPSVSSQATNVPPPFDRPASASANTHPNPAASTSPSLSSSPAPAAPPGAVIPRQPRQPKTGGANTDINVLTQTKRMTRLYVDDSDDETLDPLPPIPEQQSWRRASVSGELNQLTSLATSTVHAMSNGAPQLPRLSFGMTLTDALGMDDL